MAMLWQAPLAQAQTGLLVIAHGGSATWNEGVRQVVSQVHWDGPIATGFLMGEAADSEGWARGVARLVRAGAHDIVVVPLLVSSQGAHYRQIRFLAGETAHWPEELTQHSHPAGEPPPVPMRVTPALDDAPELAAALTGRWAALSEADRRRPLVLVAHGPNSDAEAVLWIRNLQPAADALRNAGGIPVEIGLLRDDAPVAIRSAAIAGLRSLIEGLAQQAQDSVAVLPVLISSGTIDRKTIPRDLAGLPVRYTPAPLAPLAPLARWIERMARAGRPIQSSPR